MTQNRAEPSWRAFEAAVAQFLAALEPGASVLHDVRTPDLDTGLPRQRDVWIETALFGGLFRLKILVSCKRKTRRLSQQDIDAFAGELRSSDAHKGVLYAHGGFSKSALAKAARLGVSCCRLFEDSPAELPQHLVFEAYAFRERSRIEAFGVDDDGVVALLNEPLLDDPGQRTVLRALVDDYEAKRQEAMASVSTANIPGWTGELRHLREDGEAVMLTLIAGWSVYRARREAWLVNGSYSFTEGVFAGAMSTPWMDQQEAHPGPSWEAIEVENIGLGPQIRMFSHGGDLVGQIEAHFRRLATGQPGLDASVAS
ncbi:MAG: restriction endonuclease [Caulobacter sp.]|nr:restriction endonuclease [Caulobacter sp.]